MMQENDDFFLSLFLSLCHPKGVKKAKHRDAFFCKSQKNKKKSYELKKREKLCPREEEDKEEVFWTDDFHHKPSTHKPHISYLFFTLG